MSVSVSAFESPALFSQQRLPGFALPVPPSLPPSFSPSLPPAPLFRGAGGRGFLGCHWCPLSPPTPPRAPAGRPPPPGCGGLCPPAGVAPPPPPPPRGGGGGGGGGGGDRGSFVAASRGEISRLLSLPLRPGSRRVASLGGGGSGPSSGVWAAGAVASPAAGDSDPSSGRSSRLSGATWRPLVYCPSPSGASASPSGGL